ncbi:unnamed protein product [Rhizophagus irregularis]|nr:unnamed protein product [Rhizophagus irregularis]
MRIEYARYNNDLTTISKFSAILSVPADRRVWSVLDQRPALRRDFSRATKEQKNVSSNDEKDPHLNQL